LDLSITFKECARSTLDAVAVSAGQRFPPAKAPAPHTATTHQIRLGQIGRHLDWNSTGMGHRLQI
jgi:hypothetical protein